MDVKIGITAKPRLGDPSYKLKLLMTDTLWRICLHFLGGAGIAAYLFPEGPSVIVASLALIAGVKALYDYFDKGRPGVGNALAVAAGGLTFLWVLSW